jgi:hypothetical protein
MITVENLRKRIDQEFTGECHLTDVEARLLFDVYEAACTLREYCRDPNRSGFDMREGARLNATLFDAIDAARSDA